MTNLCVNIPQMIYLWEKYMYQLWCRNTMKKQSEEEIYLRVLKSNIPSFKAISNNGRSDKVQKKIYKN